MKKRKATVGVDYDRFIEERNIGDMCTEYMTIFGANVVFMRQLSSIYDGCKPGLRRLLYTMYTLGLRPEKKLTKVPTIVGTTLKFHPHGDKSVEDTLVNVGRPYVTNHPLVDKQGNFGSVAGDDAASGRYIESKLSKFAWKCYFEEFDKDVVDTTWNYLDSELEPEFFPAKYPVLLLNGTYGLGFSTFSHVPCFNLNEVFDLTLHYLRGDDTSTFKEWIVPDSPTGAYIIDEGNFKDICQTGMGQFKMRAVIDINEEENSISIRKMPFQRYLVKMRDKIIKVLTQMGVLNDIRDRSHEADLNYTLILKDGVDPQQIIDILYKKTDLEVSYNVSFRLFEDFKSRHFTLSEIIHTWIRFRREIIRRRYSHKLSRLKEELHTLEKELLMFQGLNVETALNIVRSCKSKEEVIKKLMKNFDITSLQASAVASMRLDSYSKDAIKRSKDRKKTLLENIKDIEAIIKSSDKIDKIIEEDLLEGKRLFGTERKSPIIEGNKEKRVLDTEYKVMITKNGYIKKMPGDIDMTYFVGNNDEIKHVIVINNRHSLLLFDKKGYIHKLPVDEIPDAPEDLYGTPLKDLIGDSHKIVSMMRMCTQEELDSIGEPSYLIGVTKHGRISKVDARFIPDIRRSAIFMKMKDDDKLADVKIIYGLGDEDDVLIYTKSGDGIRISPHMIRETRRGAIGVGGVKLDKDKVLGLGIVYKIDTDLVIITEKGYTKRCKLDLFDTMARNTQPIKLFQLEDDDKIAHTLTSNSGDVITVYTIIDTVDYSVDDIPRCPKSFKGSREIKITHRGNKVLYVNKK